MSPLFDLLRAAGRIALVYSAHPRWRAKADTMKPAILSISILAGLLFACSDDSPDTVVIPERVTYDEHIAPLMKQHCTRCHAADKVGDARLGAPVELNLDSYPEVKRHAVFSDGFIQAGTMPPRGMPTAQRALYKAWLEHGTLER